NQEHIMSTLAHTQTATGSGKHVTMGSVCKVTAAAAIVSTISAFSADQMSRAHFAPTAGTDLAHQSELRDLLCRIDRRCPSAHVPPRVPTRVAVGSFALLQAGALFVDK